MSVTRFRRDSNMEDKVFEAGHWSEWLSRQLPKLRPIFEKMFWHANHLRPFRWSVMAAEQARA
jgi:hypothetical protein